MGEKKKKVEEKTKRTAGWRLALWGLALTIWIGAVLIGVQFLSALFVSHVLIKPGIVDVAYLASPTGTMIYQAVIYVLSLTIAILLPWKVLKMRTSREELGLEGLPTWTDILLGPIGFVLSTIFAMGAVTVMEKILPSVDWEEAQNVGYDVLVSGKDYLLAFIALVVIAPICEEILFRGWLYGKLRGRMKALPAILLTSLMFGIVHLQWNVGVTVFVMSVFMCIMRELTGAIYSGIILHMIKNGLAFYLLFMSVPFLQY